MAKIVEIEIILSKAECFYGDILCEYAESRGQDPEVIATGEWQPTFDESREAISEAITTAYPDLDPFVKAEAVETWMMENYDG